MQTFLKTCRLVRREKETEEEQGAEADIIGWLPGLLVALLFLGWGLKSRD
jgi:hypothetical protein